MIKRDSVVVLTPYERQDWTRSSNKAMNNVASKTHGVVLATLDLVEDQEAPSLLEISDNASTLLVF